MTRGEYELGRAGFRLARRLQREIPVNPNRLQVLRRHRLVRNYAALVLPLDLKGDPLLLPLKHRLLEFEFGKDGIPF